MRVLLINPFYPISETPSPPLGLAFLAAALERAGVEVRILDLVVFPYTKGLLERVLTRFRPHMVGATSVTMTFDRGVSVLRDVKDVDPETLRLYERVLEKKEGVALTSAKGGVCSACGMQLRPQLADQLHMDDKIVVCESCSRILYPE